MVVFGALVFSHIPLTLVIKSALTVFNDNFLNVIGTFRRATHIINNSVQNFD